MVSGKSSGRRNLKPILYGIISWIVIFLLFSVLLIVYRQLATQNLTQTTIFQSSGLFIILIFFIGGLITGYNSRGYIRGILNGAFVGLIVMLIPSITTSFIVQLYIIAILTGAIGGLIGVFGYNITSGKKERIGID
jgi:hypothetical protein